MSTMFQDFFPISGCKLKFVIKLQEKDKVAYNCEKIRILLLSTRRILITVTVWICFISESTHCLNIFAFKTRQSRADLENFKIVTLNFKLKSTCLSYKLEVLVSFTKKTTFLSIPLRNLNDVAHWRVKFLESDKIYKKCIENPLGMFNRGPLIKCVFLFAKISIYRRK